MAVDPSEAQQNPEGGDDLDQAFAELTALIEREAPPNAPVGGQSVGPDVVNYPVPYFRQSSPSRCWYTSLHMIVAFCRGLNAEFTGHPTALAEGQKRDEERDAIRAQQKAETINGAQALKLLKALPPRGLKDEETPQLAEFNGLREVVTPPGGWTSESLADELRSRGPLWCAVYMEGASTKHVVVVKGVRADGQVKVHDPQAGADCTWTVKSFNERLLGIKCGILYLPATTT